MAAKHKERIQAVLQCIETSLHQPVSMDRFAHVAAFSPFHIQRLFMAHMGVGISEYRRLMRLKRAGEQLAFRQNMKVTEVGLDTGYENSESFSRAFKNIFGVTPSEFRKNPDWSIWQSKFDPLTRTRMTFMPDAYDTKDVRIVDFPETRIAELTHHGDPALLPGSVRRFIVWRSENRTPPPRSATFNILYDDPEDCPAETFRFGIGCEIREPVAANSVGVVSNVIPAGRCAVLRHKGSLDFAGNKIRSLYRDWLPDNGEELRDFPLFVQRLTFFPDVPEYEIEADIFLPLK